MPAIALLPSPPTLAPAIFRVSSDIRPEFQFWNPARPITYTELLEHATAPPKWNRYITANSSSIEGLSLAVNGTLYLPLENTDWDLQLQRFSKVIGYLSKFDLSPLCLYE
jgi:hypothetical protein